MNIAAQRKSNINNTSNNSQKSCFSTQKKFISLIQKYYLSKKIENVSKFARLYFNLLQKRNESNMKPYYFNFWKNKYYWKLRRKHYKLRAKYQSKIKVSFKWRFLMDDVRERHKKATMLAIKNYIEKKVIKSDFFEIWLIKYYNRKIKRKKYSILFRRLVKKYVIYFQLLLMKTAVREMMRKKWKKFARKLKIPVLLQIDWIILATDLLHSQVIRFCHYYNKKYRKRISLYNIISQYKKQKLKQRFESSHCHYLLKKYFKKWMYDFNTMSNTNKLINSSLDISIKTYYSDLVNKSAIAIQKWYKNILFFTKLDNLYQPHIRTDFIYLKKIVKSNINTAFGNKSILPIKVEVEAQRKRDFSLVMEVVSFEILLSLNLDSFFDPNSRNKRNLYYKTFYRSDSASNAPQDKRHNHIIRRSIQPLYKYKKIFNTQYPTYKHNRKKAYYVSKSFFQNNNKVSTSHRPKNIRKTSSPNDILLNFTCDFESLFAYNSIYYFLSNIFYNYNIGEQINRKSLHQKIFHKNRPRFKYTIPLRFCDLLTSKRLKIHNFEISYDPVMTQGIDDEIEFCFKRIYFKPKFQFQTLTENNSIKSKTLPLTKFRHAPYMLTNTQKRKITEFIGPLLVSMIHDRLDTIISSDFQRCPLTRKIVFCDEKAINTSSAQKIRENFISSVPSNSYLSTNSENLFSNFELNE